MIDQRVRRRGLVAHVDEGRGYGEIEDEAGGRWWFHCTEVADGSRRAPAGALVDFRLVAGRGGRFEAVDVQVQRART